MDIYLILKTIHILSSTVLLGTGAGIAFLNLYGQYDKNITARFFAAKTTVLMDFIFTAPAVILQPLTGIGLIHMGGYEWNEGWLMLTYALYALVGLCWLPVVAIQIRLKSILRDAVEQGRDVKDLPSLYHKLMRAWFILGWPAFLGLITIFLLMVTKEIPFT